MKRIICVMLTLIMLVSAVPAGAITASAASMTTTGASITVLKNMLKFRSECYQIDGKKEFRIGYGSICKGEHKDSEYNGRTGEWLGIGGKDNGFGGVVEGPHHKMNQATADNLLRKTMQEMDQKVNSFASSNGLSLSQGQFDALALFSYLTGTAWMSGNGTVKTAVKKGADSTEMMNAFYGVLNKSYEDSIATDRSMILTNMYFNGIYSNSPSESYKWVRYDANGGSMPVSGEVYKKLRNVGNETYEMYFDASKSVDHPVTPTKRDFKFVGWYFAGSSVPKYRSNALDSSCKNATLVALWQGNGVNADNANSNAPEVNYGMSAYDLPTDHVYTYPGKDRQDSDLDDLGLEWITITREYLASDGSRWGKFAENKWVCLNRAVGSSSGGGDRIGVNVTNAYVNIRKEANIYSLKVGTLNQGDRVYISRTEERNGFKWGHAYPSRDSDDDLGWIAVMYTDYNTAKDGGKDDDSSESKPANTVIAKATVTYPGYVNVRDNPGTDNKIVGSLAKNEIVSIYEIRTVNGNQWGRTSGGWFCLTYAHLQMLEGSSDISNPGSADYTFTGKATSDMTVFVDTTTNSNTVDHAPKAGDSIKIITLRADKNFDTWAKISWTYEYEDEDGDWKTETKYGWVEANEISHHDNADINLDIVKFTVVADSVNVRRYAGSGSELVTKLDKGYEFNVRTIVVYNGEIWGCLEEALNGGEGIEGGWVNLASKYVKRTDRLNADDDDDDEPYYDEIATVVGVEKVNVRRHADIKSDIVGQLKFGATAYVIEYDDGWYKLDVDVDNDPDTSSWVSSQYLEVKKGSLDPVDRPSSRGTGVVANTYAGLNVRTGPGTAYPIVGTKLLPGTPVKILETKYVGTVRWGRIADNKWVCMDYITMTNEVVDTPAQPDPEAPNGGEWVGDYDEVDRTTTTAVYTGTAIQTINVWANTEHHDEDSEEGEENNSHVVRTLEAGSPVNIYELIAIEERVDITSDDPDDAGKGQVEKVVTHFWARTNDGYILDPQNCIGLDPLDEKVHTLTGSSTLNVRKGIDDGYRESMRADPEGEVIGKLNKGDKVKVTKLSIVKDKVWGLIEYAVEDDYIDEGWIRLDYMAEGALYEESEKPTPPPTTPTTPAPPSNENSTGDTGKSDGSYRYDGKIINTNEVKVRAQPTTASAEVTKLKAGKTIYIYDTTIGDGMAWGRCDAGYVYLYYVDMTPRDTTYVDARVVYRVTDIYSDAARTEVVGSYTAQAVIDIYETVGNMARTELGWVYTGDLL